MEVFWSIVLARGDISTREQRAMNSRRATPKDKISVHNGDVKKNFELQYHVADPEIDDGLTVAEKCTGIPSDAVAKQSSDLKIEKPKEHGYVHSDLSVLHVFFSRYVVIPLGIFPLVIGIKIELLIQYLIFFNLIVQELRYGFRRSHASDAIS